MRSWRYGLAALAMGLLAQAAGADDLARQAVPRKWIEAVSPETLPALTFPKYYKDLDKARAMAFAGRYKLALLTLAKVTKGDPAEIAIIKGTCLSATGRKDEALAALSEEAIKDKPRVQVLRARVLSDLGREDEAIKLLKEHVGKNPKSLAGQFALGEIAEKAGNTAMARTAYQAVYDEAFPRWQDKGAEAFEQAEDLVTLARATDRWATLNQKYKEEAGLHNAVFKMFVAAYDIVDTAYWPAHLGAAEFALSRDNQKEGTKELAAALKGNPNDIHTRALAAQVALSQWNFDGADQQIAAIRAVDSNSIEALLLESRNLIQQRRPRDAMTPIEKVLARQPKHLEAMGLQAAIYALQLNDEKAQEVIAKVEQINAGNASAYLEVAEALGAMRQYPRSAAMYKKAIERAPWWVQAHNGLGLLYTQSGDEDLAYKTLETAKVIDPFNHRTHNYLVLLDMMQNMGRKETDHFVIVYDAKQDPLVPVYFAPYMESIHRDVCGAFKTELKDPSGNLVKTLIEVFPTHDAFSVRTTGSPWIGTVGASTGRVIALVSPRKGRQTLGTYNWATVLRHEYTHTVTLHATDNRISHWMTEGLAVMQEGEGLRWEWAPMLYQAVKQKQLFTMDNITWGFVRPKRPNDRSLAYAQSSWVCRYIEKKWGYDTLIKMMEMFRQGKEQDEVFLKLLNLKLKDFDKEFFAWAEEQVKGWGYDPQTTKKYEDLTKKGQSQIDARQFKDAVATWEEACKLRPMDALPHQRLAGLYIIDEVKDNEKALVHLQKLSAVALKDNRFAKKIARVYMDMQDWPKAEKFGMDSVYIEPYDLEAHELLVSIYEKSGNKEGLDREKKVIPALQQLIQQWKQENSMDENPNAPKLDPTVPE